MADEPSTEGSGVQGRSTDYLSAVVERRAKAQAASASPQQVGDVNPFKVPLAVRGAPDLRMEIKDELPAGLRPTRAPVAPIPKFDLLPSAKISSEQEAILRGLSPTAPPAAPAPERREEERAREPKPEVAEPAAPSPPPAERARRTRAVEMPEPGERPTRRREFYAPEWDRYYNPRIFENVKVPRLPIERQAAAPDAPPWELIGQPKGAGVVTDSRAPYRASLKSGGVKDTRPQKEVARFVKERSSWGEGERDVDGPSEVPPEETDDDAEEREIARRSQFEAAMAELERGFASGRPGSAPAAPAPRAPARGPERAAPAPRPSPAPAPRKAPPAASRYPRPIAHASTDQRSEEADLDVGAEDEEEETLGRAPPPSREADRVAHRELPRDLTGESLCPTCGRRITHANPVMVCTNCARVACAACGKFTTGPTPNLYHYEYKFNLPLCIPCFESQYNIQKNLAKSRACLASGNLTYAYYHAQTALALDPKSPYAEEAESLVKQVEARRAQMQKAERDWEAQRKKFARARTTVLK